MREKEISTFLSFILRHAPESIGLVVDPQGWARVDDLLERAATVGKIFTVQDVLRVVANSDKQRFTLSADGKRIRAAQGHSIAVDLGLEPKVPPAVLFHGTARRFLAGIAAEGLKPQSRQKFHLSSDEETARCVGQRHGQPVVLKIDAAAMHEAGCLFWQAENGVWLTDGVLTNFIDFQ